MPFINRFGGGGGEDVTAEVTAQVALLTEMEEALVGKASGANATAADLLENKTAYVGKTLIHGTLEDTTAEEAEYTTLATQLTEILEDFGGGE